MEQENVNILNFNDALNALNTVSESFNVSVWVPSKQKEYSFKELEAKQQKNMLSSAMNSSVYNTSFVKNMYNVINSNFLDKENKNIINDFTIFDNFNWFPNKNTLLFK